MSELRIAIRESATELSREQTDMVAGGRRAYVTDNGYTCSADMSSDCWIEGGAFRFNDDP
jgi:hypothetical protein